MSAGWLPCRRDWARNSAHGFDRVRSLVKLVFLHRPKIPGDR